MTKLRPKTCGVWTTKTYSQLGRENEQLHHEISYYESLVDDDNETDWPHRDRRFRDWLQQRLQRLAAAEAVSQRFPQLLSLCERMVAAYGVLLEHYRRSQEQLAANGPGELSENPGELPSTGRPVMNGEPKIDKK